MSAFPLVRFVLCRVGPNTIDPENRDDDQKQKVAEISRLTQSAHCHLWVIIKPLKWYRNASIFRWRRTFSAFFSLGQACTVSLQTVGESGETPQPPRARTHSTEPCLPLVSPPSAFFSLPSCSRSSRARAPLETTTTTTTTTTTATTAKRNSWLGLAPRTAPPTRARRCAPTERRLSLPPASGNIARFRLPRPNAAHRVLPALVTRPPPGRLRRQRIPRHDSNRPSSKQTLPNAAPLRRRRARGQRRLLHVQSD